MSTAPPPTHSAAPRRGVPSSTDLTKIPRLMILDTFWSHIRLFLIAAFVIFVETCFVVHFFNNYTLRSVLTAIMSDATTTTPSTTTHNDVDGLDPTHLFIHDDADLLANTINTNYPTAAVFLLLVLLCGSLVCMLSLYNIYKAQEHFSTSDIYRKVLTITHDEIYYDYQKKDRHLKILQYAQFVNHFATTLQCWGVFLIIVVVFQFLILPYVIQLTQHHPDIATTAATETAAITPQHAKKRILTPLVHCTIFLALNIIYGFFVLCYYLPDYIMQKKPKPQNVYYGNHYVPRNITKAKRE